jgi:GNAT superfamily N-acetyltransferase
MKYTIRQATEDDLPAVLELIRELARFERAPDKVSNNLDQMKREKDLFRCFVAETSGKEIVGMALYFFAYYTWVGKSLYLEDLIVNEAYRNHKIGTELLRRVMQTAKDENCKRVRWQVLEWNEPAISFYRKTGAEISSEWLNCTFDEKGIADFRI